VHSFVLFSVTRHQVSCRMQDEIIGEGFAAMVPWHDVRAPIEYVFIVVHTRQGPQGERVSRGV